MHSRENLLPFFQKARGMTPWLDSFLNLQKELTSVGMFWIILCLPGAIASALIMLYYNDIEEKTAKQDERQHDSDSPLKQPNNVFQDLFRSAKQVHPLYAILPCVFASFLWLLHLSTTIAFKPLPTYQSVWNRFYSAFTTQYKDPRWLRDFTLDFRPMILSWFCLVPLLHIIMMTYVAASTFLKYTGLRKTSEDARQKKFGHACMVFKQNRSSKNDRQTNFYSSGWFNPTMLLPFVLGVPAAISLWIYTNLGVDALFGHASMDPKFYTNFVIIGLYLYGLGSCLTALFFRSYFSFPWNYDSFEYDIEVYPDVIKQLPIKGWFYDFLILRAGTVPRQICWKDVQNIRFGTEVLKVDATKKRDPFSDTLAKVMAIFESLARKLEVEPEYIYIIGKDDDDFIGIKLWELTAKQKIDLFHALKSYCPSIYLDDKVQEALVGSSVLREPRYTEIWFSVLSDDSKERAGDLVQGTTLSHGKYTVLDKLGSGGQAVVYHATEYGGKEVVLKEFRLTPGESIGAKIESAKDFENESAILAQLNHPAIVNMLEVFYESGRVYIVLEKVDGQSLREVVAEHGPMTVAEIDNLAQQMCSILEYLHCLEPAIVHRDFTPDNIILQPDGRLKLIDFSVAERKEKKNRINCAGKHSYTPPEQFAGNACPQSDIYALGATLYFLATGEDPTPITNLMLPGEDELSRLSSIVTRCTKLDLNERFESAQWIKAEIEAREPIHATELCNEVPEQRQDNCAVAEARENYLAETADGTIIDIKDENEKCSVAMQLNGSHE